MSRDDKVIQFPGVRSTRGTPPQPAGALAPPSRVDDEKPAPPQPPANVTHHEGKPLPRTAQPEIPPDVQKALAVLQEAMNGGCSFICIGVRPTKTGADFITCLHGNEDDLRNAEQSFPEIIGRLYARKGLR